MGTTKPEQPQTIGERFRYLRLFILAESQEAFAERLGVDTTTVWRIESGITKNPKLKMLERAIEIANAYGYSLLAGAERRAIGFKIPPT